MGKLERLPHNDDIEKLIIKGDQPLTIDLSDNILFLGIVHRPKNAMTNRSLEETVKALLKQHTVQLEELSDK